MILSYNALFADWSIFTLFDVMVIFFITITTRWIILGLRFEAL